MVVFTCNNCGDSVNKPKVEKHMQYECKRKHFAPSFCCVDCLKDFDYETVKDHCQCVTEEQRYSAKGFVPKPSAEKGKRKQAGWVDIVQSVIERKDLPNDERQFLNVIAKYDNVPRKKNKFQNFCFSSAPAYRKKAYLVDKVFDMIEAEYKAQQVQNSNEKPENTNDGPKEIKNEIVDKIDKIDSTQVEPKQTKKKIKNNEIIANESTVNETEEVPGKKKKKSKKSVEVISDAIEKNSGENIEPQQEKKKKRKEKCVLSNVGINQENGENTTEAVPDNSGEIIEPQKEKKKKKKEKGVVDNNSINQENCENTPEVLPDSTKKSKKKKKNSEVNGSIDTNGNVFSEDKNVSETNDMTNRNSEILEKLESQLSKKEKKEKKKNLKYQHELEAVATGDFKADYTPKSKQKNKRKRNNNEENEEPQQKILKTEETPQVPELQTGNKFEWNEAIIQVVQTKKKKPMSIDKVMKRVTNEYRFLNGVNKKTDTELKKIFLKKLKKMKNLFIDKDKIKLVEQLTN